MCGHKFEGAAPVASYIYVVWSYTQGREETDRQCSPRPALIKIKEPLKQQELFNFLTKTRGKQDVWGLGIGVMKAGLAKDHVYLMYTSTPCDTTMMDMI